MKVGFRPFSQQRKRPPPMELPKINKRNSYVLKQNRPVESSKTNVLQELFENFEKSSAILLSQNYRIISAPNELQKKLTECSTKFSFFQNTVGRLYGHSLSSSQGRRTGLVSGGAAVRSSFSPFISSYNDFIQKTNEEWRTINRKINAEVGKSINEFTDVIHKSKIDFSSESKALISLNAIKDSFDLMFHGNVSQGQTKITNTINSICGMVRVPESEEFKNRLLILFKNATSWILSYDAMNSSKDEFQELLNDYIDKFDLQDNAQMQMPSINTQSRPFTAINTARYIPGMDLEEVIENGARILEKENNDFFRDLRDSASRFKADKEKTIKKKNNEIEELISYKKLFETIKEKTEAKNNEEVVREVNEKLDLFNAMQKENEELKSELARIAKLAEDSTKEMEAYKSDNIRISKVNSEQNDRYSSFLAKMASVIGTEAKEEDLLNTLANRKQTKNSNEAKDIEKEKLEKIVGESSEKLVLIAKIEEFKTFLTKMFALNNEESLQNITKTITVNINKLKGAASTNKVKENAVLLIDDVVQEISKKESIIQSSRNSLIGIVAKNKGFDAKEMNMNDLIEEISKEYGKTTPVLSNDSIYKIFAPVLDLVETSSKTDATVYLPEVSYFFILMHQSIQSLKPFATDLDDLFDKFEFKLPQKGTPEFDKMKNCSTTLTTHLRAIVPSQMHSIVFHTLSRLVIFIEALSNSL